SSTRFATKSSARPFSSTRTLPGLPGPTGSVSVPVIPTSSAAATSLDTLLFAIARTIVTASAPAIQPITAAHTPVTTAVVPSRVSAYPAPPPNVNMNTQNRSEPNGAHASPTSPPPASPPSASPAPSPWSVSLPPSTNDATSSVTPNAIAPR